MVRSLLIALAAALAVESAQAGEIVSSFAGLPTGDELLIQYATQSCTHSGAFEFRFVRDRGLTVSVVRLERGPGDDPRKPGGSKRVHLGTAKLEWEDMADLDRLLRAYRTKPNFSSSGLEDAIFTQKRDGKVIVSETYLHRSRPRFDERDALTFEHVVRYVQEHGK